MRVVVHIPARSEWRPLLAMLPDPRPEPVPVGEVVRAEAGGAELICLRGGVGKTRSAASAQYAICTWRPDLYLLLGTSGAVDPGLAELDLVRATSTLIYDFRLGLTSHTASPLLEEHRVDCPGDWAACPFPLPVAPGVIATGDGDVVMENAAWLRERFGAAVADWESGAVALVCALNATPWLVLRGVSDTPTAPADHQHERFRHNTPLVMERLWSLVPSVVAHFAAGNVERRT